MTSSKGCHKTSLLDANNEKYGSGLDRPLIKPRQLSVYRNLIFKNIRNVYFEIIIITLVRRNCFGDWYINVTKKFNSCSSRLTKD